MKTKTGREVETKMGREVETKTGREVESRRESDLERGRGLRFVFLCSAAPDAFELCYAAPQVVLCSARTPNIKSITPALEHQHRSISVPPLLPPWLAAPH